MIQTTIKINDDEFIKLSTDEEGAFSLEICGYPYNGGEDTGIERVSILLNYKELHEFIVKSDLLLDGKIK